MKYAITLEPPPGPGNPVYWIGRVGGDGPGWTLFTDKDRKCREVWEDREEALYRLENLPLVAELKVEEGWSARVAKIGAKKKRAKKKPPPDTPRGRLAKVQSKVKVKPDPTPATASTRAGSRAGSTARARRPRNVDELLAAVKDLADNAVQISNRAPEGSDEEYWAGEVYAALAKLLGNSSAYQQSKLYRQAVANVEARG